ncbi:MAG: L-threonine 3-dehydrogenase [Verrucomicrobia bacterium]|nr:L-threonine 3-dehydrogenase [Verrucomicrobiota bacterium]MCG2681071.1 L-threonine 3-dehydrogenase [Kiritimatiellia bacterium]MBU4248300.1 L-threonine 3-dehydrogenase [Verrucomicrobiota bacterium]MBU4290494.1 L-threonine 3-dehydrogenase [Verrucomicrobiota bacterium]MBU4427877.1 L-threonine 3-dehydrogenase [Verrucomicrobiota bacterium]
MKALVKSKAEPGIWLQDVPVPEMGINDVMIKIEKTAICGTDIHIYKWDSWSQKNIPVPLVIGHEFVGRIEAIGANVTDFRVGDLVSGEGHLVCGRCRNCLAGRRHLCPNTRGIGVNRNGAFAQYLVLPQTNVWYADTRIPTDVLACFDPLGNAVHTALSFPVLGEDVLITGAGPIGCMATAIVKHAGARYVIVTDINPDRLAMAKKMGATLVVNPGTERVKDAQKKLGMQEGFDVGLEMSGSASALREMLENMCHGGKIAMLGIPEPNTIIDWNLVVFHSLTIQGVYGREMYETWYKMTMMIQTGLDIASLITHRFPYTEYQQAFEVMKSGKSGKVILNWSE